MEKYDSSEPVNLGNGKEVEIKNLVDLICNTMGHAGKIKYDSTKPDGQPSRRLDISRAISSFDFSAQTVLADGLRETVDWYLATEEAVLEC
jgi:nucleoside-diphosphate-sugar epimerase